MKLGSELCAQNTLLERGWALSPEQGRARRHTAPASFNPNAGDPNAIICRPDQERSHLEPAGGWPAPGAATRLPACCAATPIQPGETRSLPRSSS